MARIPASARSKIVREFVEKLVLGGKHYVQGNPIRHGKLPEGFGKLKPDVVYTAGRRGVKDKLGQATKYVYQTNHLGQIIKAPAQPLQRPAPKLPRASHSRNPTGKLSGNHASHLFTDIFSGSGRLDNIVAQLDHVNPSRMKIMENKQSRWLDQDKIFDLDLDIIYDKDGLRPIELKITEIIDEKPQPPHPITNSIGARARVSKKHSRNTHPTSSETPTTTPNNPPSRNALTPHRIQPHQIHHPHHHLPHQQHTPRSPRNRRNAR